MIIILIILCIYFSKKPQKAPVQGSNDPDKVDRLFAEWKAQKEVDEAEAIRQAAILAEAKRQEKVQKLSYCIEKAKDEIIHFCELAETLTKRRDNLQKQLDELRTKIHRATYELDPVAIAHGDKCDWRKTANGVEYMKMYADAFDQRANVKKEDTAKMEKQAETLENKIASLNNQIFAAEQRVKKAEYEKYVAEQKLAA